MCNNSTVSHALVFFCDLTKAFDGFDHSVLTYKLEHLKSEALLISGIIIFGKSITSRRINSTQHGICEKCRSYSQRRSYYNILNVLYRRNHY